MFLPRVYLSLVRSSLIMHMFDLIIVRGGEAYSIIQRGLCIFDAGGCLVWVVGCRCIVWRDASMYITGR